jgi:hypothetical protein
MQLKLVTFLGVVAVVAAAPAPQSASFGKNDVPNGPAPEGCSKFEIIVGQSQCAQAPCHITDC